MILDKRLLCATSFPISLALTACVAPTASPGWVKAGADGATTERELSACNEQASAAFARYREAIDATVGRNWMLQGLAVVPLQRQLLLQQAAEDAKQVVNYCMGAKGFTRESRQMQPLQRLGEYAPLLPAHFRNAAMCSFKNCASAGLSPIPAG